MRPYEVLYPLRSRLGWDSSIPTAREGGPS
jgi:hypothetical protein